MTTRTSPRWALLVALAAVLVHLRALDNGFALDDVRLVSSNPSIASLAHVPRLFLEPYWNTPNEHYGLYRPLTVVSLTVDRALFGAGPFGFHLVNVLLHAAASALAWFALRRAGTHYGTALLGAGLFAVLPIHTEAVANIAGRPELLAAFFVLAAWIAHRRASDDGAEAGRWRLAATALYLAAILSKESAILAPALFLADDAMRGAEAAGRRRLAVGYLVALAAMLALRIVALGPHQLAEATIALDNPAAAAGAGPRVATALWVQLKYALLCAFPRDLVSDYSYDAIPVARSIADVRVLAGLGFMAAIFAAGVWGWRRSRPVTLAVSAWALFSLPAANLLFPTGTIMAERLAYLPSLGYCLLVGHLGAAIAAGEPSTAWTRVRRIAVVTVSLAAILLAAARTRERIPDWNDNLSLAMADVATSPRSAKLQAGAGMFLVDAGQAAEAEAHLRRAIEIYPEYAQMHYNLAVLLLRRGARTEAAFHLRRAIDLAPANPLPRHLLDQLQ